MESLTLCEMSSKKDFLLFFLTSIFLPSAFGIPASSSRDTTINIKQGKLSGIIQKTDDFGDTVAYLGVPYGLPPEKNLRFRPPQEMKKFPNGEFAANELASSCFGTKDIIYGEFPGSTMWNARNSMKEDCLNMNIWVPTRKLDVREKLPVLVWIYGGGFFSGTPSLDLYKGPVLAASQNIIVVNINYRLGPFGFLFLGEDTEISGNMGLKDQQMALKWIQNNIVDFGGDPEKVTLFGESAGSASVSSHLISPGSRDLFARAILQSGAMSNRWAFSQQATIRNRSIQLFQKLGCWKGEQKLKESLDCLSRKSGAEIQANATPNDTKPMEFGFVPVIKDGVFFPQKVTELIEEGNFKKCPIIVGTVLDEGTFWLPYTFVGHKKIFKFEPSKNADTQTNPISRSQYDDAMNFTFYPYYKQKGLVQNISRHYLEKENVYSDPERRMEKAAELQYRDGVALAFHDFFFHCDVLSFANALAHSGRNQVYAYFFNQRSTLNPWPKWTGVMHGYEIEYFFGAPFTNPRYTDAERDFSRTVMGYWGDFARSGKPAAKEIWPQFDPEEKKIRVLSATSPSIRTLIEGNCDFWSRINSRAGHWQIPPSVSGSSQSSPCQLALLSSFIFAFILPFFILSNWSRTKRD